MAKNSIKQEIKKPDIVIRTFAYIIQWVRNNLKQCIASAVAILVVCICIFAYTLYIKKQDDKAQYILSQGIKGFSEYNSTGSEASLKNAEDAMGKVISEGSKKTRIIAKLYLGRIYYLKGKIEDSRKMYREVQKESTEPTIKELSGHALDYIEKKQHRQSP